MLIDVELADGSPKNQLDGCFLDSTHDICRLTNPYWNTAILILSKKE